MHDLNAPSHQKQLKQYTHYDPISMKFYLEILSYIYSERKQPVVGKEKGNGGVKEWEGA